MRGGDGEGAGERGGARTGREREEGAAITDGREEGRAVEQEGKDQCRLPGQPRHLIFLPSVLERALPLARSDPARARVSGRANRGGPWGTGGHREKRRDFRDAPRHDPERTDRKEGRAWSIEGIEGVPDLCLCRRPRSIQRPPPPPLLNFLSPLDSRK